MFIKNLWKDNTAEAFGKGDLDKVTITNNPKAAITLDKRNGTYCSKGIYTSPVIYTSPFDKLVMSWNAETPKGTSINIAAQVLLEKDSVQIWSDWLSWGNWSLQDERFSASVDSSSEELVSIDTDTLKVKASGCKAAAFQYRLTLFTSDSDTAPSVMLVAGTFCDTNTDKTLANSGIMEELHDLSNLNKELKVPRFSQMLRDPKIASVICSPTSITMILNYYGLSLLPEQTAAGVYDTKYDGFGNWPFNTAFAGNFGFEAYVVFCNSIYDLKREVFNGYPAAVSVKYKNRHEVAGNLPVINGAPIAKTNGHLIVVCGFIKENGKEYVIVNDPAASCNEAVRLKYLAEEFEAAWQTSCRMTYIIHP